MEPTILFTTETCHVIVCQSLFWGYGNSTVDFLDQQISTVGSLSGRDNYDRRDEAHPNLST